MVRIFAAIICLTAFSVRAQEVETGERGGLLEVSGSIYPTFSLNSKSTMNFVGGHLAYQLDDKYSFRGDMFVMTSTQSGAMIYNDYFLIEAGFLRNFTKNRFDYFVGIELGLTRIQIQHPAEEVLGGPVLTYGYLNRSYYQPVFDLTTGFKFHVNPYFYFYAETKLLNNRNPEANQVQSNLAVTGGLGIQLPVKKLLSP
jgi:hypothetical protein